MAWQNQAACSRTADPIPAADTVEPNGCTWLAVGFARAVGYDGGMDDVHTINSPDGLHRIVFSRNFDGTFGFREEARITEPPFHPEPFWITRRWPDSRCDTLELAIRERRWRESIGPQNLDVCLAF